MSVIDFREMPQAKGGEKDADAWELFARDFFAALGLEVEVGPGRGADAGRDLLVVEQHRGQVSVARVRWVVSCKHFAHSGDAVSERHEQNILERVKKFAADGFIGFYSTLPTSALNDTLTRLQGQIRSEVYDRAKIEGLLLGDGRARPLIGRYFPESFKRWQQQHQGPVNVWDGYEPLTCGHCGKDLLIGPRRANVGFVKGPGKRKEYVDLYWACKGVCDRTLKAGYEKAGCFTGWRDVSDLVLPPLFLQFIMSTMNRIREDPKLFNDRAHDKLKELILILSQVVVRDTSPESWKRIATLESIPEGF